MTPKYRKMILEDHDLTPISDLSQAFYQAKSGDHIMFAYYESLLVVKYIVDRFGEESLRAILKDLSEGMLINDAIAKNTTDLEKLEEGFAAHVVKLATDFGPGIEWKAPDPDEVDPTDPKALDAYARKNPKSFWARQRYTQLLLDRKMWENALLSAEALINLFPDYVENGNGYELQARAYRGKGDLKKEAEILEKLAAKSSEAYQAYARLLQVNFEKKKWPEVTKNADRAMSINPFLKEIHYCSGCAHQAMNNRNEAVRSFEKSLNLKPANPSEVRFRLAKLLKESDSKRSKRYLLDSLADSPRYREAHALLLDLNTPKPISKPPPKPE